MGLRQLLVGTAFALLLGLTFGATPVRADAIDPPTGRLDLNRASLQEIQSLPIPRELAESILDYRLYNSYFDDFYELRRVEGMTPRYLSALRPLVATLPPDRKDEVLERYDASFRQVQRFLGQEGASEEIADEYLDLLREPQDINRMSVAELQSFQNVSPVDAVAIVKARERSGGLESDRQLRSSEGMRYWAYRNLRDYVIYEEKQEDWQLHGDLQLLTFNSPYRLDDQDALNELKESTKPQVPGVDSRSPAVGAKLRLRLGHGLKGGIQSFRNVGEAELDETRKGFLEYKPKSSPFGLRSLIVGNYRVAFGQGLVMDNTDFFLPRKTGFGWNKRPSGILGDLSRSHAFALRGAAAQFAGKGFTATGFFSNSEKDGVLNADGSINRYLIMRPRYSQAILDSLGAQNSFSGSLARNAFEETVFGGNLRYEFIPGTWLGVSSYEARYDKAIRPDVNSLFENTGLLDARDSELFADYNSEELGKFRRVVGAEVQAVYENVAVQGEYAKLDSNPKNGLEGLFADAPEAFVLNGHVQYEDLSFLALYRDADVGFDNPYARGFANNNRYQQTLLGDAFRLNNPLLNWLELNTPQMKPERGLFLSTRYRFSRKFQISGLDFDQYTRVADGQDVRRWTFRAEYAPTFPLRFRIRHRYSSRGAMVDNDVRRFQGWDTRLEARVRLSAWDELRILYSTTNTAFAPRPRLSGDAEPGRDANILPQAASPSQALQGQLQHNVNANLMFTFTSLVYDGFLWNFEDNEFVALDGQGFRNWFLVRTRLGDSLLLRAKITHDRALTQNNIQARDLNNNPIDSVLGSGGRVRGSENSFRLQLDYTF